MELASEHNINIKCFVSDSAGEYAAARYYVTLLNFYGKYIVIIINFFLIFRRQMRIEYKDKIFLPCMAHQINLVVGDIFKESDKYKNASAKAIKIVSFFNMAPYFAGHLRDEQMAIYQRIIALTRPGDTRWNSYYFCFNSLLRTEAALRVCLIF